MLLSTSGAGSDPCLVVVLGERIPVENYLWSPLHLIVPQGVNKYGISQKCQRGKSILLEGLPVVGVQGQEGIAIIPQQDLVEVGGTIVPTSEWISEQQPLRRHRKR